MNDLRAAPCVPDFDSVEIHKNTKCPVCSSSATPDYFTPTRVMATFGAFAKFAETAARSRAAIASCFHTTQSAGSSTTWFVRRPDARRH
jgi:hypothetical protein